MSDPNSQSRVDQPWRAIYADAIAEKNPRKLQPKVAAAEAAIFHRLQELAQNSGSDGEQSALRNAAAALLSLKTDILNYPGWRQE